VILIDCKQGDEVWLKARCGIPSASEFSRIVTSKGAATSSTVRARYLNEKIGERVSGSVQVHFVNDAMERGTNLEPKAREWYEATTGADVVEVGFCHADKAGRWGASPDGLVGDDGGIEIKCPQRPAMIDALRREHSPTAYSVQVQGCMWVTGRSWWDVIVYTDDYGIPNRIWRVTANEAMHAAFAEHIPAFCDEVEAEAAKIEGLK
jgi:putative phage-type endonuclease